MPANPDLAALSQQLAGAMRAAADLIEAHRARGLVVREKPASADGPASPVTDADEQAERLLTTAIRAADAQAIIVGEEASAAGRQPAPAARFWLIDPLDGTRDYVRGGDDYSVNIGLIADGAPVLGLVLHPPSGTLWTGIAEKGAWKQLRDGAPAPIRARPAPVQPLILTSHSHLDERTRRWLDTAPPHKSEARGSSLKFCALADGGADIYPRFGPTHEWDTAAADAILRAAGGITLAELAGGHGQPLVYGKADYLNGPFLALADAGAGRRLPDFRR